MTEHKSPLETPDAIITMAYHHHKRLDGGNLFRARVWLAKVLRRKLPTQRFMVWIIYRDWQERVQTVTLEAGAIGNFIERLMEAPVIRQVHVSEYWFYGRKSFGVDYDPAKTFEFLKAAAKDAA